MSRMRKAAVFAMALLLAAGFWTGGAADVFAAKTEGYNVTVYTGNQGEFKNGDTEKTIEAEPGERVTLDVDDLNIKVTGDKYYVKGLRPAGRDSKDASVIRSESRKINEDEAYVVVYGVKGGTVKYTVRHVDSAGNEILPEEEYYGAPGDKPIVSFRYREGYVPDSYNRTGTLTDNEADNVFTFVYSQVQTPAPADEGDNGNGNDQGDNGGNNQGANGGAGDNGGQNQGDNGDNGGNGNGNAGGNDNQGGNGDAGDNGGNDGQNDQGDNGDANDDEPEEIIDDDEVPFADNPDADGDDTPDDEEAADAINWPVIFGSGLGVLAIILCILAILRKRGQKS